MTWKASDLVHIQTSPTVGVWRNGQKGLNGGFENVPALRVANMQRPKEIVAYVEALSRMFERIGMHGVCRLCFKGAIETDRYSSRKGRGCCGICVMLTASQCANKPMGCAQYMCGFTSELFPETRAFLGRIYKKVFMGQTGIYAGVYAASVVLEHEKELTESQRRRLRWATRKIDAWSEREKAA